ncbi:MAG TPA: type II toxin-antitoxin system HicB family antitoxin [Spirochaetia bacterium]|nr:type II toxin-antitoxin system HicB family antitoxin [Spirochaetia bacterium]
MHYHFRVYKDNDELWAECIELEGCQTQSQNNTFEDLYKNMKEVLNLYLNEPADSHIVFPKPDVISNDENIVEVEVEPKIAFAYLLRVFRLNRNLTQKEMAMKLGFKNLWSYQKLEKPEQSNPTLQTLSKINSVFPDFDIREIFQSSGKFNIQFMQFYDKILLKNFLGKKMKEFAHE